MGMVKALLGATTTTAALLLLLVGSAWAQIVQGGEENQQSAAQSQQLQLQQQGNTQAIVGTPNLIQLPGMIGAYPNFTQPYKPEVFVNGAGPIRPVKMTYAQAERCASGLGFWGVNDDYIGGGGAGATQTITLLYPVWDKVAPTGDMTHYLGVAVVRAKDKPWLPTLCAAAKLAMDHGADIGVVEYVIRPINKSKGLMLGASVGGSGLLGSAATAMGTTSPYALAGVLGAGIGTASTFVEGEVMVQVTGMTDGKAKKVSQAEPSNFAASAPAPEAPAPAPTAATGASSNFAAPPCEPAPAGLGEPWGPRPSLGKLCE